MCPRLIRAALRGIPSECNTIPTPIMELFASTTVLAIADMAMTATLCTNSAGRAEIVLRTATACARAQKVASASTATAAVTAAIGTVPKTLVLSRNPLESSITTSKALTTHKKCVAISRRVNVDSATSAGAFIRLPKPRTKLPKTTRSQAWYNPNWTTGACFLSRRATTRNWAQS